MARPAPIALCIGLLLALVAFAAPSAHADGKVFLSIAVDSAEAGSTMPRQRAIIAFKDGEQRLAIDTAFTGAGEEFAWLVPLPSEPEILPATKGMFDTAAMITAPRVTSRGIPNELIISGVVFLACILILLGVRTRGLRALAVVLLALAVALVMLPSLSKSRSSVPTLNVEVLQSEPVGIYDTTVLRGTVAKDVLDWLDDQGFASPDGVEAIVQDYLDRGWVFAAAKLRDEIREGEERAAHPLQFRFSTERPVYPMALTAVGNESIELELFVFADGAVRAGGLRLWTALETKPDERPQDYRRGVFELRSRPVSIAHPGLADIWAGLPMLTRLSGRLSPREQQQDLWVEIDEPVVIDPLYKTAGARWSSVVASGIWASAGLGLLWLFVNGLRVGIVQDPAERKESICLPCIGVIIGAGFVVSIWMFFTTPGFHGTVKSGASAMMLERELEQAAMDIEAESVDQTGITPEEFESIRESVFELLDISPPTGDSPLHYRIVFNDDDTEAQFIWHDLIGAEHRVVIPLASDSTDDAPTP